MCVYKNHAFIYFLRPPSWSGTRGVNMILTPPIHRPPSTTAVDRILDAETTVARSWRGFSANPTIKIRGLAKNSAIFLAFRSYGIKSCFGNENWFCMRYLSWIKLQSKIFSYAVCLCSAVDTIGSLTFINNIVLKIYTATFPLFPLKFRSNSLP